jgi:rhamnogalacturonyl hydrolase YesR
METSNITPATGHPQIPEYAGKLATMAASLAAVQGSDGLWRASLLDPTQFANPESTSTGLITYALAWGVNNGYLPATPYTDVVAAGWNGLATVSQQASCVWPCV